MKLKNSARLAYLATRPGTDGKSCYMKFKKLLTQYLATRPASDVKSYQISKNPTLLGDLALMVPHI